MSYRIGEAIAEGRTDLDKLTMLQERYPAAEQVRLPDGRLAWSHHTIEPSGFLFCVVRDDEGLDTGDVILCPYEEVEGVFVFAGALAWQRAVTFFERLQKTEDETFTSLLERFGK